MDKITKSLEDYLEAIYVLELKKEKLHSVAIANLLNVSKPAVTKALNELKNKGYVTKDIYQDVSFTKKGREIAKNVYYRHTIIKEFLIKIGVKKNIAEIDCCKIEHVISKETLKAFEKELKK